MMSSRASHVRRVPGGLILAVALIQLAHLVYFDPFTGTYGDTVGYVSWADTILTWPAFGIFYQPLYPAFLKTAMLLTDPEHFRRFVVLAQITMVVATSILVYSIAIRLTDSRWLASAAALLLSLEITLTVYEYLILTEILAIFLSVLFIYASYQTLIACGRGWAVLAGLSLLALALTKFGYVPFAFVAGVVSVMMAWRLRKVANSESLRRYALALSITGILLAAKVAVTFHYTGALSVHGGWGLVQFLNVKPEMVLRLPDGDPDLAEFKSYYARHGQLFEVWEELGGSPSSAKFTRAAVKIYSQALLRHPIQALGVALSVYYRQNSQNVLFCYPEERNHRVLESSQNVLFMVEKGINRAIFGTGLGAMWTALCLVLGVLLLLTSISSEQKILLSLLLAFILFSVFVSTWLFNGTWISDNTRMRLMYEAPMVALWFSVPYRLIRLRGVRTS